ncbi:MAG: signal peptidase II [Victivallales bacterium]
MIKLFAKSTPHSSSERKIIAFSIIVAGLLLLADQISKMLVAHDFELGESVLLIKNFLSLTYVTNKGAAWGILNGYAWLLLLIATVVMGLIIYFLRWLTEGFHERYLALLMIISGIVGNSIDRIWRGEVVDFLDLHIANYHWPPVFNVADSAICVGVCIFLLSNLLRPARQKKEIDEHRTSNIEH